MKIVFTGGDSGGHFYPIVAVAKELRRMLDAEQFSGAEFYFIASQPYNKALLDEHGITYVRNPTGKRRTYASILNVLDIFKTLFAILRSLYIVYKIFPDVVFSKGGYSSLPVCLAARFYGIPIIIHESDSVPGRANAIVSRFAYRIAISYPQAAEHFKGRNTALTGNPVRDVILADPVSDPALVFKLDPAIPTVLVVGGSQGAERINDTLLAALPSLLERYQVIHQIGEKNVAGFVPLVDVTLETHPYRDRYRPISYLTGEQMRAAAALASLIVSRGGSTIFEIALWGKPSIIIPITESNGDHQRQNAFSYARAGACEVIDETNLTPNLFLTEIDRIVGDPQRAETMSQNAKAFSRPDAATKISQEIMKVVRDHYGIT